MMNPVAHGKHREIGELIPWYLNGRIGERDRLKVEAHLARCARCRDALELERAIFQGISSDPAVEYMPAASLKRLNATLDALDADPRPVAVPILRDRLESRHFRPGARIAAAVVGAVALAWGLEELDRGMQKMPSPYHTVTASVAHPSDEVIRAVFAPNVTLEDLQSLLDEAGLRIVAGPTEAGVYSLASTTRRPVRESLVMLRRHVAVRFAETTPPQEAGAAWHGAAP
jgi:hypothetical protein